MHKTFCVPFTVGLTLLAATAATTHAAVPSALEPDYADAILALHDGKSADALVHLREILKQSPDQLETLQLSALTLKSMGRTADAKMAYEQLLKVLQAKKAGEVAEAPYHFELGVLAFGEKNYPVAEQKFTIAQRSKFNLPATHFFLGLVNFQNKVWNTAESHFQVVTASGATELKPAALLYLSQITRRRGDTTRTLAYLTEANQLATEQAATANDAGNKMLQQVLQYTQAELGPYRQARWFGQLGLASGYDSNVLTAPDGVTGATGSKTGKATLLLGLGYATGPADGVQFIPSYRGNFNYNTNQDTKTGQLLVNTFTLYVNAHPLAKATWGLKTEGQLIFSPADNSSSFSAFSLVGSVGPYYRRQLAGDWILQGELFAHPQKYFNDNLYSDTLARSGWGLAPRVFVQKNSMRGAWNPTLAFVGDYTNTSGSEYRSKGAALELQDFWYLDKLWTLELAGTVGVTAYDQRTGLARTDKLYSLRMSANRQLSRALSLTGDIAYIGNSTNIDTYAYTRLVTSVAVNYFF